MFTGEASCLVVFMIFYYYHKLVLKKSDCVMIQKFGSQKFSRYWFLIPALCDFLGTSLMYIGLNLTSASSFQMLRGSIIIFTALMSSILWMQTSSVSLGWYANGCCWFNSDRGW